MYFSFFFEACFRRAAAACKNGILYMQISRKVLLTEWGLLKYECFEHNFSVIFALFAASFYLTPFSLKYEGFILLKDRAYKRRPRGEIFKEKISH